MRPVPSPTSSTVWPTRGASIRIPRDTEKSGKGLPKKKKKNVVGSVQGKGGEETLGGSSHLVSV